MEDNAPRSRGLPVWLIVLLAGGGLAVLACAGVGAGMVVWLRARAPAPPSRPEPPVARDFSPREPEPEAVPTPDPPPGPEVLAPPDPLARARDDAAWAAADSAKTRWNEDPQPWIDALHAYLDGTPEARHRSEAGKALETAVAWRFARSWIARLETGTPASPSREDILLMVTAISRATGPTIEPEARARLDRAAVHSMPVLRLPAGSHSESPWFALALRHGRLPVEHVEASAVLEGSEEREVLDTQIYWSGGEKIPVNRERWTFEARVLVEGVEVWRETYSSSDGGFPVSLEFEEGDPWPRPVGFNLARKRTVEQIEKEASVEAIRTGHAPLPESWEIPEEISNLGWLLGTYVNPTEGVDAILATAAWKLPEGALREEVSEARLALRPRR